MNDSKKEDFSEKKLYRLIKLLTVSPRPPKRRAMVNFLIKNFVYLDSIQCYHNNLLRKPC